MHSDAASVSDTPDLVDQLEEVQEQRRARKPISVKLATGACPVCKQRGHRAGFVGAVYVGALRAEASSAACARRPSHAYCLLCADCPNKPCYLCKTPGHSTSTCPYRAVPAARLSTGGKVLAQLMSRELGSSRMVGWLHRRSAWGVTDVASKVHDRRVSVLAFHPRQPHVLISGDKVRQLCIGAEGCACSRARGESVRQAGALGVRQGLCHHARPACLPACLLTPAHTCSLPPRPCTA